MTNIFAERAVAIFGMMFWLAFPIGLMLSIIIQHRHAHSPKVVTGKNNQPLDKTVTYTSDKQEPHSDEYVEYDYEYLNERIENFTEEENPSLHYLKGREKLHQQDNHPPRNS